MITGKQIKAARAWLGWTQETLSERADIGLTTIKGLEDDKIQNPTIKTLKKIEAAFVSAGLSFKDGGVFPVQTDK